MDAQKFDMRKFFQSPEYVHAEIGVGKGIFLGGNDHKLCLAGIGREIVADKPLVNGVCVCLLVISLSTLMGLYRVVTSA